MERQHTHEAPHIARRRGRAREAVVELATHPRTDAPRRGFFVAYLALAPVAALAGYVAGSPLLVTLVFLALSTLFPLSLDYVYRAAWDANDATGASS